MFRALKPHRPWVVACYCVLVFLLVSNLWNFKRSGPHFQWLSSAGRDASSLSVTSSNNDNKFLTFLPHSGFHNQRIALINAAVLAYALNRTLLMPEINLGIATFWRPFSDLEDKLDYCPSIINRTKSVPESCFDYRDYAPVPVDTIFDLSPFHKLGIRTLQRQDMRRDYFQRHDWDEKDIYVIDDTTRYSYQIHDNMTAQMDMRRFQKRLSLQELQERPERLLYFGSLFGSHRLALSQPELSHMREHLRRQFRVTHPLVLSTAEKIVERLGGTDQFTSVHLRQGDGFFKKAAQRTMVQIRETLEKAERAPDNDTDYEPTLNRLQSIKQDPQQLLSECVANQVHNHPRLRVIYMATDARRPREQFPQLHQEFLCLFTLHDFPDIVEPLLHSSSDKLNNKRLLPLIDAEVAVQAESFIPTPRSTFSGYIRQRQRAAGKKNN